MNRFLYITYKYNNLFVFNLCFRQFIAGVLKTKGLRKALKFLDELYKNVLRKAHLTLKEQSSMVNTFTISINHHSLLFYI